MLEVVKLLNRVDVCLGEIEILIEDILFVGNNVNIVHFCHIYQEVNKPTRSFITMASFKDVFWISKSV